MAAVEGKEQPGGLAGITDILAKLISESEIPEEPSSRVERKRRKTRSTIISATEELMQSRPLHELTISEITSAADVGHGTFYLHFKSKYEVVIPIIYQHTLEWDVKLQAVICNIPDPAEAVAYSGRNMGRLIVADPLWRWLLQEEGVHTEDVRAILGRFVIRDIEKGFESGRFAFSDVDTALSYIFGGVVTVLATIAGTDNPDKHVDQAVELLLRTLGIPVEEATKIVGKDLKPL